MGLALEQEKCLRCQIAITECECLEKIEKERQAKKAASTPSLTPPLSGHIPWKKMTWRQKILAALGYGCAALIAIGCGISIAAAFVSLNIMSVGAGAYTIAGILFCAGTVTNWLIYKNSVPEVLIDMFGRKKLFQVLRHTPDGKPLPKLKVGLMIVGLFCAIAVGIAQAVLNYAGTFTLPKVFTFLAAISPGLPYIAAVLAAVAVICLTATMLKNIAILIKTKDVFKACGRFLKNLFDLNPKHISCDLVISTDPKPPQKDKLDKLELKSKSAYVLYNNKLFFVNKLTHACALLTSDPRVIEQFKKEKAKGDRLTWKGFEALNKKFKEASVKFTFKTFKPRWKVILEKALTLFVTLITLPLAGLGLYMTMNASAGGTKAFFLKNIPKASAVVVDAVSKFICLGLAIIGRIPFTIRNLMRTIPKLLGFKKPEDTLLAKAKSKEPKLPFGRRLWAAIKKAVLWTFCIVNAIGNGLISMIGGAGLGGIGTGVVIGIAGTENSLTAGIASGLFGGSAPAKPSTPPEQQALAQGADQDKKPTLFRHKSISEKPKAEAPARGGNPPTSGMKRNRTAFFNKDGIKESEKAGREKFFAQASRPDLRRASHHNLYRVPSLATMA